MNENSNEIRLLEFPDCIRTRPGMYIGSTETPDILFREIIDNSCDEIAASGKGHDGIIVEQDFNGYHFVADQGRGIPIYMSPDKPTETQAAISVSALHSGSKFQTTEISRVGQNGIGSSASNALSESYILMSKITEHNYDKSIREVYDCWNSSVKSKKDLFYIVAFEKGVKVFEGANKLKNIEKMIWGKTGQPYREFPKGFSTIVMFKPDPEIFEKTVASIPAKNIQYFLLIQEKFYKRKISSMMVNGEFAHNLFNPYQFELIKTVKPVDSSKNKSVSVYVTFEVDPELGNKKEEGSVNGLVTESGVHINYISACFEQALRSEFKVMHKYLLNGLKICTVLLAGEVIFGSQTKTSLKSISKVKQTDFKDVTKEFIKIFRSNREYWEDHVHKLNMYAESMKSFSASDKAKKMVESSSGSGLYRSKLELVPGFADAIAPASERMNCELFLTEGLSPAGSLKNGRKDTRHHAVMPLRGKVLNVSDKTAEQMLDNKELYTIFKVIGLGLDVYNVTDGASSYEEAWAKICSYSRYGKIVISCDEDPDGKAIANALLYAISKFARFLIDFGMVWIAESPSYIQDGKFFYTSDPLQPGTRFPIGLDLSKPYRYIKGLGGLNPEDVYDSFFNPATRRLVQVTSEGLEYSMSLVEDINQRKKLLFDSGVLSNPYNFTDL